MTGDTLLLRQIHPSFVQNGNPTSQAFTPTPKDESKLSVDDGDLIEPEASWQQYIRNGDSAGVMAVSVNECQSENLVTYPDPLTDNPAHAVIDFTGLSNRERERKSKKIKQKAIDRGWLFRPTSTDVNTTTPGE